MSNPPPRYAHSLRGKPPSEWETVQDHCLEVSRLAGDFADKFGVAPIASLLGKWHDVGKFSEAFQRYLTETADDDEAAEKLRGSVDHSTAGGKHLVDNLGKGDRIRAIANAMMGHHGGLADHEDAEKRLKKEIEPWKVEGFEDLLKVAPSYWDWLKKTPWGKANGYAFGFLVRMLYSCLVDADFLCAEAFRSPHKSAVRKASITISELLDRFLSFKKDVLDAKPDTPVNRIRKELLEAAIHCAKWHPGLFSLTAPTGSGKTFSSLAFALAHALMYGLDRVIYVIPYTSIIEQTAKEFRKAIGNDAVLEHHSNLVKESITFRSGLLSENWDAPVVVTTSVQFFESLHANLPSRCRKLHRLSKSVIILDEAQTIPVKYLEPCLRCLNELVSRYGSTVVLCTATQPALEKTPSFKIGLEGAREIAPEPKRMADSLRRTQVIDLGKVSRRDLKKRLESERQALCIVNTTRAAREIYRSLNVATKRHLSTRMVPWHRQKVLEGVIETLKAGLDITLVSTQMVEAGVNFDFPVVFRARCGLDSVAQAAGRCNREGKLDQGIVFLFEDEEPPPPGELRQQAEHGLEVYSKHKDNPLGLDAIQQYFLVHYQRRQYAWDQAQIIEKLRGSCYDFKSASDAFRYIDDDTRGVVITRTEDARRSEDARRLVYDFERLEDAKERRRILRMLQQHTVNLRKGTWDKYVNAGRVSMVGEDLPVLVNPDQDYSMDVGLFGEVEN
jgi:CRISPR-associated endonuclease/helicase Cas3